MRGLNRIFLIGRLGNDPRLFSTASGKSFTNLSIATHRNTQMADGESKETTDWHFVRVWGKQAETCSKHLTKGRAVSVEGYLTQYVQQKGDGEAERKTSINAIRVDFLPGPNTQPTTTEAQT
ncbi:MAG: hypothetical protein A2Z20_05680 [Bdellovibrionales bacterium RBG_16_40_8]|nr:MAG: hypothetical protein A2Z20_05680 [Bdellovibrionales bacterium RBG_16_40_8]